MYYAFFVISYVSLQHHWRPQLFPDVTTGVTGVWNNGRGDCDSHSNMNAVFMWYLIVCILQISLQNIPALHRIWGSLMTMTTFVYLFPWLLLRKLTKKEKTLFNIVWISLAQSTLNVKKMNKKKRFFLANYRSFKCCRC